MRCGSAKKKRGKGKGEKGGRIEVREEGRRGEGGSRSEREENADPDSLTHSEADGVLSEDERALL